MDKLRVSETGQLSLRDLQVTRSIFMLHSETETRRKTSKLSHRSADGKPATVQIADSGREECQRPFRFSPLPASPGPGRDSETLPVQSARAPKIPCRLPVRGVAFLLCLVRPVVQRHLASKTDNMNDTVAGSEPLPCSSNKQQKQLLKSNPVFLSAGTSSAARTCRAEGSGGHQKGARRLADCQPLAVFAAVGRTSSEPSSSFASKAPEVHASDNVTGIVSDSINTKLPCGVLAGGGTRDLTSS